MVQENIAVGNWTQTHDQIYLNSRGGAIMLDSSKPNGMIKLLADTTLGLATSQAGIYVDSLRRGSHRQSGWRRFPALLMPTVPFSLWVLQALY